MAPQESRAAGTGGCWQPDAPPRMADFLNLAESHENSVLGASATQSLQAASHGWDCAWVTHSALGAVCQCACASCVHATVCARVCAPLTVCVHVCFSQRCTQICAIKSAAGDLMLSPCHVPSTLPTQTPGKETTLRGNFCCPESTELRSKAEIIKTWGQEKEKVILHELNQLS